MKFIKGDKYKHYTNLTSGSKKKKGLAKECIVIQDCERHVTVDFGNYKGSVLKAVLLTGEERLEKVV